MRVKSTAWQLVIALVALLALAPAASAVTITFGTVGGAPNSYTEAGMTVSADPGEHLHLQDSDGDSSIDLLAHDGSCCSSPFAFAYTGPFTLQSFDSVYFSGNSTLTSSTGATFTITGLGHFVLPGAGWTGITSFSWDVGPTGNSNAIDNVQFVAGGAVPMPGTLLLLGAGLGLAGLAGAGRRRRRV